MIHLLAIIEAATITGPAKNLLEFCRTSRQMARGEDGVEVTLATFTREERPTEFIRSVEEMGIPLIRIPEKGALDRGVIGRLRTAVLGAAPDIVQTHAVKSHFLTYLSGIWKLRPWVAFHHGYTTTDRKMLLYNHLDRISLRKPARLVTVSSAFEKQLVEKGIDPRRILVLHNSVDLEWAARVKSADREAIRAEMGIGAEEIVLFAIGRMSREKAHIDLIEAYHRLRKDLPVRLILAGDGPERSNLERAAQGAPVIFTGQVRNPAPYYAAADMMILPSLTEGSPNVLLEAMAAEVPVVATRVGGIPEIVEDGKSALLVPPRDPAAIAQAIRTVAEQPELRKSLMANAYRAIVERHSPEARTNALIRLCRELVN